jgi:hypothetical protein
MHTGPAGAELVMLCHLAEAFICAEGFSPLLV